MVVSDRQLISPDRLIDVPDAIADGDQTVLEDWSNDNNVFQAIRLEDAAYDKNDPRTVYIADTGRSRVVPDPTTPTVP